MTLLLKFYTFWETQTSPDFDKNYSNTPSSNSPTNSSSDIPTNSLHTYSVCCPKQGAGININLSPGGQYTKLTLKDMLSGTIGGMVVVTGTERVNEQGEVVPEPVISGSIVITQKGQETRIILPKTQPAAQQQPATYTLKDLSVKFVSGCRVFYNAPGGLQAALDLSYGHC